MTSTIIQAITAREIIDSRGDPTLEVTVRLENGLAGVASVPSGASTGTHEAFELRDGDKVRYGGKGVLKAIQNVNSILAQALRGRDVILQEQIDEFMGRLDGTPDKRRLGANSILGVSLACARAGAISRRLPLYEYIAESFGFQLNGSLPLPMMNMINGGRHASNGLDVQEFLVVPHLGENKSFAEHVRAGSEIFHTLGIILTGEHHSTDVGNEGGYAPKLPSSQAVLTMLTAAITQSWYRPGENVSLALDVAASELSDSFGYMMQGKSYTAAELISEYKKWSEEYALISVEDGLGEDSWEDWKNLTASLGQKLQLVGDDLFVTQKERLEKGIEQGVANAILIKPNQVGTLSETISTVKLAQTTGYNVIISHRSGETTDSFIADLAVAVGAKYIKTGSMSRGERVVKYNRLMEIEQELSQA